MEPDGDALPVGAPKPGELFAGKYTIERVLGVGGMGYVLAATHVHLNERVAIKLLLAERAKQPETVARFLREGRAAVKIRSEHVARVLDVGTESGAPFLVMEYLDGRDLAAVLHEQQRLPVATAVDWILQACEAIAEAHAMGTVHRDLKPANLFVALRPDGRECVKVLDFGISKTNLEGDDVAVTKTTATVGTPLYMSPEQLTSSKNVDARTDIWSLGIIAFELLAGRPPFQADTIAQLGALVLTADCPDLRELAPDVPAALADAIGTCLRRDPAERFATLAEFAAAIAPFGTGAAHRSAESISRVLAKVARPDSSVSTSIGASRSRTRAPKLGVTDGTWGTRTGAPQATPAARGRRWLLAAAALAIVAVGVGGGAGMRRLVAARPEPPAASASTSANGDATMTILTSPGAPLPPTSTTPSGAAPATTSTAAAPNAEAPALVPAPTRARPSAVRVAPSSASEATSAAKPESASAGPAVVLPPAAPQPATSGPKRQRIDPTNPY